MTITSVHDVIGMTCDHCVKAVTYELNELAGVIAVNVDLAQGSVSKVTITSAAPLSLNEVAAAVEEAGYEVRADPCGQES